MKDEHTTRELQDACRIAQERFNELAATHQTMRLMLADIQADLQRCADQLAEQVSAIAGHARALHELGEAVPIAIEDADFYRGFVRGLEAGELHAELDAIAAVQGFRRAA